MQQRTRNYLRYLVVLSSLVASSQAVRINEISDKGTADVCQGNDWIELYHGGAESVDLSDGYMLHDDKGMDSENAYFFPAGFEMLPNSYLLVCTKMKISSSVTTGQSGILVPDPSTPQFGIGSSDTISLVKVNTVGTETVAQSRNSQTYTIVDFVTLTGTASDFDVTYAFNNTSREFAYTSTPTPGAANVFTALKSKEEKIAEHRANMRFQNRQGMQFFGMDNNGYKVEDAMDDILEMRVTMTEEDYDNLFGNKTFEVYQPFQSLQITSLDGEVITSLNNPGRIRTKGQSTLWIPACLGAIVPFQLDISDTDPTQTLFGVEKLYLRHHMGDLSYTRDYTYNRMLARFGLPHLRARKVVFYINDEKVGFYTLMEAMDQEYVFARNFKNYNPDSYALYKVKSMAMSCGAYKVSAMEEATARLDETATPPYAFQRGQHRKPVEELGIMSIRQCAHGFVEEVTEVDYGDTVLAYQRYDEDCAAMLMGEGLIERDLGTKNWDKNMEEFISNHYRGDLKCDQDCANSHLKTEVDTKNFLKTFAFYAVTLIADSPLINGNNLYLGQSGDEDFGGPGGWKILPYDFNAARVFLCHDNLCNTRFAEWSIVKPTCESLEQNPLVGPILTDPELHSRYLEYVREFTDTIYANQTFIEEIQEHLVAQNEFVRSDIFSFYGAYYDMELSPDAADWREEIDRFPLLPTMKARAESIREQLKAIDEGKFPRGPHVGVLGNNEAWEYCPDWKSEEANKTACELGCKYEGCDMPEWTVDSFCDELTGTCLHGDYDEQCRGVLDGEKYPGMEDTEDGRATFCRFAQGIPVKAAECPAVGAVKMSSTISQSTSGAASKMSFSSKQLILFVAAAALAFGAY